MSLPDSGLRVFEAQAGELHQLDAQKSAPIPKDRGASSRS